jgi:hypothetical protein
MNISETWRVFVRRSHCCLWPDRPDTSFLIIIYGALAFFAEGTKSYQFGRALIGLSIVGALLLGNLLVLPFLVLSLVGGILVCKASSNRLSRSPNMTRKLGSAFVDPAFTLDELVEWFRC